MFVLVRISLHIEFTSFWFAHFSRQILNRNYYLLEKVGQKKPGLLPSKNYELTVSHFRARTREKPHGPEESNLI